MLRMLDLFAGIGGFSYAGEKLVGGYETVAFCEYDEHAQKVLRKHWPDTEIIKDVRNLANDADRFRGLVDIITGGYPCQPFSQAGKRLGDQDDRHLWPEMLRVVQAVRPRWVVGENVAGHISMGLDVVLSDLEAAGYSSRCFVIPAVAADAKHRRDRCWIVAHTNSQSEPDVTINQERMAAEIMGHTGRSRLSGNNRGESVEKFAHRRPNVADANRVGGKNKSRNERGTQQQSDSRGHRGSKNVADTDSPQSQRGRIPSRIYAQHTDADCRGDASRRFTTQLWEPEPGVGRVANGISGRVHRLRQLGNSIVPQVAARILWSIREIENGTT